MSVVKDCYQQIRQWIGENHKAMFIVIGGIVVAMKVTPVLKQKVVQYKAHQALKKWENTPKDVVIFHTLPRGKTIPNLSPFAMKLETYLRVSQIPYKLDTESPWGPVGKTPWITLNGKHVADSQLIIKLLNNHFHVTLGEYMEEERARAKAVRIMMDEYLYWGIALWRYVHSNGKGLDEIFDLSPAALKSFYKVASARAKGNSWAQGIGRHSEEQVTAMMKETLETVSLLLGDNQFLLGSEPCEEDSSLFGFLSMVLWATPGSPYVKYMTDELPNLKNYCSRMKTRFWDDWDDCLAISSN